jgi:hypothetical protein
MSPARSSLVLLALVPTLPTACDQVTREPPNETATVPDEVQRIFDTSCALAGCHDGARDPDLRASASAAILKGVSPTTSLRYVVFGKIEDSYLAIKLLGTPEDKLFGDVMPLPSPLNLDQLDRAILLGWIAGAPLVDQPDDPTTDASSGG